MDIETTQTHLPKLPTAKTIDKAPPPFREMTFSLASMADHFGIARSTIYELEKSGLLKAKVVNNGVVEKRVFDWTDYATLVSRYSSKLIKPLNRKVKVFANLKGGVGKSTIAVQFAMRASSMGYRVLVIDMDPQGHATLSVDKQYVLEEVPTMADHWFEDKIPLEQVIIPVTPLFSIIPANLSLASAEMRLFMAQAREQFMHNSVAKLLNKYDLIVIDTNPSESNINTNCMLAADEICVVSATNFLSVNGIKHFYTIIQGLMERFQIEPNVRIIPNLFDMRDGIAQESLGSMRKYYNNYLTQTVIRKNTDIAECQKIEQAIWQYSRKSTGADDIDSLTKELLNEGSN